MSRVDLACLAPLIIIALTSIILMLIVAVKRSLPLIFWFSVAGFLAAFFSLYITDYFVPSFVSSLLVFDGFTILFSGLIILTGLFITLLSHHYIINQESEKEEFFIILFIGVLGSLLLVAASGFVALFLGLETLSVSLFILVAYRRARHNSMEAGVKYLILASVSSAFLLFGMGLIYTETGSLQFSEIGRTFIQAKTADLILLTGLGMIFVGIGFKLALVPFHMWTPDIYQGAPVPVATFVATISKGAVLALILRFFYSIEGFDNRNFIIILTVIAVLSMFIGNLLAIRQENIKRILAYSSIANMGYIIVTLLISNSSGPRAAIFYMLTYIITIVGAFGVINLLSDKENDFEDVNSFRGLFWRKPWVALVMTLCMLSLAGIPLTAGFMAKFYLVFAGLNSRLYLLVISLVLSSVIGLYYYLRIITSMFSTGEPQTVQKITFAGNTFLALIAAGILWFGLFPQWILSFIDSYINF